MNSQKPWYERIRRWGQTNLTEMDPGNWDKAFWKQYWEETRVQGVIINAGGIVAYYPSQFELQYRAKGLGDRDMFKEFSEHARQSGLAVLARMDINRATKEFYDLHPDWFAVNPQGEPIISNGRYYSCINSPYYKEYVPAVLKEIILTYHPDGITDNSWTGVSRKIICHCSYCKAKFKADTGLTLPVAADYNDSTYRMWIKWSYACRIENWDLFNEVTTRHGGPNCLWVGMFNADPFKPHTNFCDIKEVGKRTKIIMCDHQARDPMTGSEQNGLNGHLLHDLAGWDTIIPESMANYVIGPRVFRQAGNPTKETQLWMIEGISGGISPWFHHIGANQEDRRQFKNAPPIMQWHERNEEYLYNRKPVANIGLVWSQENTEFYGCENVGEKVALPWHGFVRAMIRARIPFVPVHADHIAREAEKLDVLILPDVAAMTDSQCEAVVRFVESGGSLVYTGASGTLDEWGQQRTQSPLEAVTGIKHLHDILGVGTAGNSSVNWKEANWDNYDHHNYIRLPDDRHSVLVSFEDTSILPLGGSVQCVESNGMLQPIATYIPSYPIYPPEFSWPRERVTDIPVMFAGEHASGGRIFYFAGDVDRGYGRTHLPDLGDLLANAVKWAAFDTIPVKIEAPGYLDCKLYQQEGRLLLHVINLTTANHNPGYIEEFLPVGPIAISIRRGDFTPSSASLKVSGQNVRFTIDNDWVHFSLESITSHELIVLE